MPDLPLEKIWSESEGARESALKRVEVSAGDWFKFALASIPSVELPEEFTGEQLRHIITESIGRPHHHNVWGALTMQAVRRGLLFKTGRRTKMQDRRSHARMTDVYTRTEIKGTQND